MKEVDFVVHHPTFGSTLLDAKPSLGIVSEREVPDRYRVLIGTKYEQRQAHHPTTLPNNSPSETGQSLPLSPEHFQPSAEENGDYERYKEVLLRDCPYLSDETIRELYEVDKQGIEEEPPELVMKVWAEFFLQEHMEPEDEAFFTRTHPEVVSSGLRHVQV